MRSASATSASERAKRALDLAGAALLLMLLALPIAVIAVAIKVDSRGAVFFRCTRIGHRGRPFGMLKFRKMVDGAAGAPLTQARDPRFTRMGRFLARSKLDELPQLWNVVTGEMSLVGPRPEDPSFVALHADEYEEILRVKPGLTGLCQLAFTKENELLDTEDAVGSYVELLLPGKVRIDMLYAAKRSLAMDLSILVWTPITVVLRSDVAVDRTTGRVGIRRRPSVVALAEQEETAVQAVVAPAGQGID
jgi:lipopolysaccharide/colanic/teichoic acid biosynthesis glycosyltransferase